MGDNHQKVKTMTKIRSILPAFMLLVFSVQAPVARAAAREMPDPLSPRQSALSREDQDALKLAADFAKHPNKPVIVGGGKMAYLYGASIPTIVAAPLKITDIELEAGEAIQNVLLGDTARWQVDSGAVGAVPHLFLKPLDAGLETNAVITTQKRVYHLRLISRREDSMPYVGFVYPERGLAIQRKQQEEQARQERFNSFSQGAEPGHKDLSALDFGYSVSGSAKWRPVQVYNDGIKTYLRLPDGVRETPILLAQNSGSLVNYRLVNGVFIVDGVFDELSLVLGVGSDQEQVTVARE
jgi:type IV secretion system protein VirB9